MTEFGSLVSDMQTKANGNGAQPHNDDDWLRTMLQTVGRYVEAQVKPLRRRIEELETRMEQISILWRVARGRL